MWITWTDNPDGTVTRLLERDLDRDGDIDGTDLRIILNGARYSPSQRQSFSTLYEQASNNDVREERLSYDLDSKPLQRVVTSSSNQPENDSVSTYTAEYDDWTIGNASVPEFYLFDET